VIETNVSIPSNGSIQFLQIPGIYYKGTTNLVSIPSNGSIQFLPMSDFEKELEIRSQSPQTGQFNSYNKKYPSL